MLLLGEIVVEILMIAALVVAVICLARLLRLSILERLYLRHWRREQSSRSSAVVRRATLLKAPHRDDVSIIERERQTVLREKHV